MRGIFKIIFSNSRKGKHKGVKIFSESEVRIDFHVNILRPKELFLSHSPFFLFAPEQRKDFIEEGAVSHLLPISADLM